MARTEHHIITSAGWTYRMNERGWVIYRDPQTGIWHTRADAIAILAGRPQLSGELCLTGRRA